MLPLIVRPALTALGNLKPGTAEFNTWVGVLFFIPTAIGGILGLLGGYLTDLLGRRRVLIWSVLLVQFGIFLATLLFNGLHSFWGNYLPRVYPTHLRGTGESFATNIGGRVIGVAAALLTTQLSNVMPGSGPAARLAYSAGTVALLACAVGLVGSFWLFEPEGDQLPD